MTMRIIAVVVMLAATAVGADYKGLLGSEVVGEPDYMHLTLQFVDADTRAPIPDVHISCTRPMVRSACSERRGPEMGQTTITFSVYRRVKRTNLFSEDLGYALGKNTVMNLTFFAANHSRGALELYNDDPILSAGRPHVVELQRTPEGG